MSFDDQLLFHYNEYNYYDFIQDQTPSSLSPESFRLNAQKVMVGCKINAKIFPTLRWGGGGGGRDKEPNPLYGTPQPKPSSYAHGSDHHYV